MGASNFARGNTSKVYAVLMDTEETFKECSGCGHKHYDYDYLEEDFKSLSVCENECEDEEFEEKTEYRSCEQYEYDDFKEYVREVAEIKAKETDFSYDDAEGSDNDKNYCASDLFELTTSKSYGDIEVEVKVTAQIVSAYYEGASLDYRLEIYNGGEWSEVDRNFSVEDILDDLFAPKYENYYSDMGKGLRTILLPKAVSWGESISEQMINLVEEIFTQVSKPLNVVATFSNGETIYSEV
jgi:hypothetical protein